MAKNIAIEKVSDTTLKVITTTEEVISLAHIQEEQARLQKAIEDLDNTLTIGEQEYTITRDSLLQQKAQLEEELAALTKREQDAEALGITRV